MAEVENTWRVLRNVEINFEQVNKPLKRFAELLNVELNTKALMKATDSMISITNRLNSINDGTQTAAQLQNKIMSSANRSRTAYPQFADSVLNLQTQAGKSFSGNDEAIAFAELMSKNLAVGGASETEQASASSSLINSMASGALGRNEIQSVLSKAPLLTQAIQDYMVNVRGASGTMADWASQGLLTADVIKFALFSTADQVEQRFNSMPATFGQIINQIKNHIMQMVQPVIELFGQGLKFIYDNWSIIEPAILGVVVAIGLFTAALKIAKGIQLAYTAITLISAAFSGNWSRATFLATAAQNGLNAAILRCPITWIIGAIILVIAAIYMVFAWINKVVGKTYSATGAIVAVIAMALAYIMNLVIGVLNSIMQIFWILCVERWMKIFEWILNVINGGFDSVEDMFKNLLGQMLSLVISFAEIFTKVFDAIFGKDITSALIEKKRELESWGKNEKAITLDVNAPQIDKHFSYRDFGSAGYSLGKDVEQMLKGSFGLNLPDQYSEGYDFDLSNPSFGYANPALDNIANDTSLIKDNVSTSSEDLQFMKSMAEREAINKYTTATVQVDMSGMQNTVAGSMDIDGMINLLETRVSEAVQVSAEGAHI